jgi:cation diffusion facilitator CzcD-associated flavoprotein CzcO
MEDREPRLSILYCRPGAFMKRVIVIGGGIAGLAAAHRVSELAKEKSLGLT